MSKIITHCDFDGVVSAAIIKYCLNYDEIIFTTPTKIHQLSISGEDIVSDLPYVRKCRYWFDHHISNKEELDYRKIDYKTIPGKWKDAPSAGGVIYEFFQDKNSMPEFFKDTAIAADKIDTMGYKSLEDWLSKSPENIIQNSISLKTENYRLFENYLRFLTDSMTKLSLKEISELPEVQKRYAIYEKEFDKDVDFLKKIVSFHQDDSDKKIAIIDYTNLSFIPRIEKNYAIKIFPDVDIILALSPEINRGRKSNNIKISIGVNFLKQNENKKDLGAFLGELNFGGGHKNAAGGIIKSKSKQEREKNKEYFLEDLIEFWNT